MSDYFEQKNDLIALCDEVEMSPRQSGLRMRLGLALLEAGRVMEASTELLLAARLEPTTPQPALLALDALVRAGRERDAALLLSTIVHSQRTTTQVTDIELDQLEQLLRHPEAYVRCHIARALGRLRVARAVDALEHVAIDDDIDVKVAAQTSLRQLLAC